MMHNFDVVRPRRRLGTLAVNANWNTEVGITGVPLLPLTCTSQFKLAGHGGLEAFFDLQILCNTFYFDCQFDGNFDSQ
jgi:hypothetical protein